MYLFVLLFIYVQKSQVQGLWHLGLSSEVKGLSGVDFGLSGTPSPNFKTREVGNPSWTLKNQPIFLGPDNVSSRGRHFMIHVGTVLDTSRGPTRRIAPNTSAGTQGLRLLLSFDQLWGFEGIGVGALKA